MDAGFELKRIHLEVAGVHLFQPHQSRLYLSETVSSLRHQLVGVCEQINEANNIMSTPYFRFDWSLLGRAKSSILIVRGNVISALAVTFELMVNTSFII